MSLPILLVSQNQNQIDKEVEEILNQHELKLNNPDLLYLSEKLGIDAIKKIRQHLNWKPTMSKYRVIVINPADALTTDAQNALLKILEEPSENALIILSTSSEDVLLETVRSRIEIRPLNQPSDVARDDFSQIGELLSLEVLQRLESIEKNETRKKLVSDILNFYYQRLMTTASIASEMKILLESERWIKQNVSAKAVSDFLMIKLPKVVK